VSESQESRGATPKLPLERRANMSELVRMVNEMHKCIFGNGDYKNNLVTDVQKNTSFRKGMSKGMWYVLSWCLALTSALIMLGVKLLSTGG